MDNLKSLLDDKNYKLIIKLTKDSTNPEDISYYILALTETTEIELALEVLNKNRDILQKFNLPWVMKMNIELLCLNLEFDKAYEQVKYFENLPYHSQIAEETLKELPKTIRDYERIEYNYRNQNGKDIRDYLLSEDPGMVIQGVKAINNENINEYALVLNKVLTTFPKQSTRSLALLILAEKKINHVFDFNQIDKIVQLNPSTLYIPFEGDAFFELNNEIASLYKDPSICNAMINILTSYTLYYYPNAFDKNNESLEAIHYIACSYLNAEFVPVLSFNKEKFDENVEKIKNSINSPKF